MRLGQDSDVARVLHILPHRGGGAETYIDLVEAIHGYTHERVALSAGRTPASAALSIPARMPGLVLAARRADLLHMHGDVAATLALPLMRARPAVVTTHGLHFLRRASGARLRVARSAMRAVAAGARSVLCTSVAERDELAALLGPHLASRLVVARNGVALGAAVPAAERAGMRASLGLADADVAVLFLGELSARKGVLLAVAAARAAAAKGAPVVLLVAGDGPQAAEVGALASAAVRPLGFRGDSARLLAAADVFVLPSEREGLSFAILEAMAAGLAMVVADGAGNPEAVGEAGIVVPAGDARALSAALTEAAGDAGLRARLGAAARERVQSEFSLDRMLTPVAAAYAAALD
jgi:glycosyltransferase involved in cell wall biosynthesis